MRILVIGGLIAYTVYAARRCSHYKEQQRVAEVRVEVLGSDSCTLITPQDVLVWLEEDSIRLDSMSVALVRTDEIEKSIGARPFVDGVTAFRQLDGLVHIEVGQHVPVVRLITDDGFDAYLSADGSVLPNYAGSPVYVPVVTGRLILPFEPGFSGDPAALSPFTKKYNQNYHYLLKLLKFVRLLSSDDFWDMRFVQIHVDGTALAPGQEPVMELVPRMGDHRIIFGDLGGDSESVEENAARKLNALLLFYEEVLSRTGWDACSVIDLRYRGQIVCRK